MNSLDKKCQESKEKYDACFNNWFSERFLKGENKDECQHLFMDYQKCVKEAIISNKIDLWHLPSEYEQAQNKDSKTSSK